MMLDHNNQKPIPELSFTAKDIVLEIVSATGIVLSLFILTQYAQWPDAVPRHFGVSGRPDAWGDKSEILMLPVVSVILYVGLTVLNRYPHVFNYPVEITEQNAERQYRIARSLICTLKAEIVWLFTHIEWQAVQTASDRASGLGILFLPIFLTILFGTLGFYLFQAYRAR